MRKKDVEKLKLKLDALKDNIINSIRDSSNTINALNSMNTSEEVDISSYRSMAYIDESTIKNNNRDLQDINRALDKIENGQYGICEMCEKQIDIKRLMTKPYARFCITCREIYEKQTARKKVGMRHDL